MKIMDLKKTAQSIKKEVEQRKAEGTVPCAVIVQGLTNQEDANEVALMAGVALNSVGTDGAVFVWGGDSDGGKADVIDLEKSDELDERLSQPVDEEALESDAGGEPGLPTQVVEGIADHLPPRWSWYESWATDTKPEWHPTFNDDRDYRREGDRYVETEIHKAYRLVAEAGAALANSEELLACYPSFGLFLDDFATTLLAMDKDMSPMATDLARRARYFHARVSGGNDGGFWRPNAALMIERITQLRSYHNARGDDEADSQPSWYGGDIVSEIREAVRNPDQLNMHRVAGSLVDLAVDELFADSPVQAESLVREAIALYMHEFDVGESGDYSSIAHCHSILGWAKADEDDWLGALLAYEDSLKWYRACQSINPDSSWIYSENIADACYAVAFLSNNPRNCRELLLEASRIYGRGVYDERNASGLIRTYELFAELEAETGLYDGVEAALYKTKAESIRSRLSDNGVECCRSQQLDVSLNRLIDRTAPAGFWRSTRIS